MDNIGKSPSFFKKRGGPHILIILIIIGFLSAVPIFELPKIAEAEVQVSLLLEKPTLSDFFILQGNSLKSLRSPLLPETEILLQGKIEVVVTGYSSSPWETDDTPHVTASGTLVKEGIVAVNILPFGTKIRFPEIYGEKIFVVEDRMNFKKGYHVDIWFPSYWEALHFGVKRTYIEILES